VQIRTGHIVLYDATSDQSIRSIHVAGTLSFDPEKDTRLTVGLIKIQAGDDAAETGFDCELHAAMPDPATPRPALEVGTHFKPISAGHSATIRLADVSGLDPENCPAIVCCGGRMEFHGQPMNRTWVKLGSAVKPGDNSVTLAEPVAGWKVGDRVIVTATKHQLVPDKGYPPTIGGSAQTEERVVTAIEGTTLTLGAPLKFAHFARDLNRGEVANLSRNVVLESAEPGGNRGHTMYHRHSSGSIGYAEFRHLGKAGKLGKYSLHFHKIGDTMRGASVIGASIWDSGNRWITIHGTNDLVVRDCVGYQSLGHGFFLEDGTEVDNILDRNLAVQALGTKPLPGQILGFDQNEGAGFWWANSRNAFTRNVAAECDEYGFRYQAPKCVDFDPVLSVCDVDGEKKEVDIRTLPFLRFEGNEAHAQRRYGLNLGGGSGSEEKGVDGVGPDSRHPFAVRDFRVWDAHWAFEPFAPGILVDSLAISFCDYGIWRPKYDRHAYRGIDVHQTRWAFYEESGTRPESPRFPSPLEPVDDRPPVTVVTFVDTSRAGRVVVRGVSVDDTSVQSVLVNDQPAVPLSAGFSDWEATLEPPPTGTPTITAYAVDSAGNRERTPHRIMIVLP
jgi:hypothetical protein